MLKVIEYQVLSLEAETGTFGRHVNDAISREGWQPIGGVTIYLDNHGDEIIAQAMVKYESPPQLGTSMPRIVPILTDRDKPSTLLRRVFGRLTLGTANALKKEVSEMSDLIAMTRKQLLCVPKLGPKRVNEIQEVLAEFGLTLAKDAQ
jgi:hypothetical protein